MTVFKSSNVIVFFNSAIGLNLPFSSINQNKKIMNTAFMDNMHETLLIYSWLNTFFYL